LEQCEKRGKNLIWKQKGKEIMNLVWVKGGCALCCIIFSVFGIIFLVGLGLGYTTNAPELVGGPIDDTPKDTQSTALACYIAVAIYGACLAFCACQLFLRRRQEAVSAYAHVDE